MGRMRIWKWVLVWAIVVGVGPGAAHAQITFERTYGGIGPDRGRSVQQTEDGGYIIAGDTRPFGAFMPDVYLIKTDPWGDTLWTRTYGTVDYEWGASVQQTQDGGYIIAGGRNHQPGGDDVYLVRTDPWGDTLWTRTYGGPRGDYSYSVQQTSDSGYIVAGYHYVIPTRPYVWLIKTDSSGDTLWTKTYESPLSATGHSVQQTSDGGYVVVGMKRVLEYDFDIWLIKTDALGDTLWTRTYGGPLGECGYSGRETQDGGYIITGWTGSFGAGGHDIYLVRTDPGGDTLWTRTYGGPDEDYGYSVQQTSDGGYVVTGQWTFGPEQLTDVFLIKTDPWGDILYMSTYGGSDDDYGQSVQQTSDGGYIITGWTYSYGAGEKDVYLIKTDSLGNVGAQELVTGGGWIPGDQPGPGNKRTFGFNAHSEDGLIWGQLQFDDHGTKMKVHSDTIETLDVYGDTVANFSGDCRVDGVSGYSFGCEVEDRGEPGHGVDKFSIGIYDADGNLYYSAGDFLGGGNIQIHTPDNGTAKGRRHPTMKQPGETSVAGHGFCQNSPNPFTDRTTLSFHLPSSGHTTLQIHDITGRLVVTLVDGKLSAGLHTATWNSGDAPAGIYFYKLRSGDFTATKKLVVLR